MAKTRSEKIAELNETNGEIVHPKAEGFVDRVTPKVLPKDVFLWNCPCENKHFRHAGYIQDMLPFMRQGGEKRISLEPKQVMVCTKCKKAYAWLNEQMYDITEHIDLSAWEATEKEAYKATGPGGQC